LHARGMPAGGHEQAPEQRKCRRRWPFTGYAMLRPAS
jgi:hypothetical protein